jgi:hypothetical protein
MATPVAIAWLMRPRSLFLGVAVVVLVVAVVGLRRGVDRLPPRGDDARVSVVTADQDVVVPTELPDSPSFEKGLSRNGAIRDYREVYTYQLGLMAFYQQCMKGRIKRGLIYYYIKWGVDDDHLATAPFYDRADAPSEGDVTAEDELAFEACVKEYLATHDRVSLPHGSPSGEAWGMRAVFPLSESPLLKMIAEAKADRSRGASH